MENSQQKVAIFLLGIILSVLVTFSSAKLECPADINDLVKMKLLGGWNREKTISQDDYDEITPLLKKAVEKENARGNSMKHIKLLNASDGKKYITRYSQVVNGINYCVHFRAVADGCKNEINADFCSQGEYLCELAYYKSPLYEMLIQGVPKGLEVGESHCQEVHPMIVD